MTKKDIAHFVRLQKECKGAKTHMEPGLESILEDRLADLLLSKTIISCAEFIALVMADIRQDLKGVVNVK